MTRLVIHVGLPKCGSSAIQQHFLTHRESLRDQGLDYLDLGFPPTRLTGNGHAIAQQLLHNDLQPAIDTLLDGINSSRNTIAFVSSEWFIAVQNNDLQTMTDALSDAGHTVEFLVLARNAIDLAWSSYIQAIRANFHGESNDGSQADYHIGTPHWLSKLIDLILSKSHVQVVEYDPQFLSSNLSAHLGCEIGSLEKNRVNRSPTPIELSIQVALNSLGRNDIARRIWLERDHLPSVASAKPDLPTLQFITGTLGNSMSYLSRSIEETNDAQTRKQLVNLKRILFETSPNISAADGPIDTQTCREVVQILLDAMRPHRFESEFDIDIYAEHEDLKGFSVDKLAQHYVECGKSEGRVASYVTSQERFDQSLDQTKATLFLSNGSSVMTSGQDRRQIDVKELVSYLDSSTSISDESISQCPNWLSELETAELLQVSYRFPVEREVKFLDILRLVSHLTGPNTHHFICFRDYRYTEDHYRRATTANDLVNASRNPKKWLQRCSAERKLVETHGSIHRHWNGDHGIPGNYQWTKPKLTVEDGPPVNRVSSSSVNCWFFHPDSIQSVFAELCEIGALDLLPVRTYQTVRNSTEFWAIMRRKF